jgi:hypothetical protein
MDTFTISECPPETIPDTLAPLAKDSTRFEFGRMEEVFLNQLKASNTSTALQEGNMLFTFTFYKP